MNKMYEYLKNHAYISYNKKSTYEFELSEERAKCIANKYDNLTEELQQENQQLKDNWKIIKQYCLDEQIPEEYDEYNSYIEFSNSVYDNILNKMLELEQGGDSDVKD